MPSQSTPSDIPLPRVADPAQITPVSTSPQDLIKERLAALTPLQRSEFLGLSYTDVNLPSSLSPQERDHTLPLAIFQTNAVSAEARGVGLFPKMARLNHGCAHAFNVVYSWREREGVLVVHALRDIAAGEELLTTYTDTKRSRAERQYVYSIRSPHPSLRPDILLLQRLSLATL